MIIDRENKAVCVPFLKFANYGEPYADKIDWSTARVNEKIDGSLIKVWNYRGKWIISTNGTIFAEKSLINVQVNEMKSGKKAYHNFRELFNEAADLAGLSIESLNPQYTYMFELCSPYTRIVVPHNEIKIYHIGTRNNETLQELEVDIGVEKPETYLCLDLSSLIEKAFFNY